MNVLIIEDNSYLATQIAEVLYGMPSVNSADIFTSYEHFIFSPPLLERYDIALIDIDIGYNCANGIDIVSFIRSKNIQIPIIMMSNFSDCSWIKKSFDQGANDYIIKPFRLKELILRIEKRYTMYIHSFQLFHLPCLQYGDLEYYPQKNQFFYNNKPINLTKKSKFILSLLLQKREQIVTKEYLLEKVWGDRDCIRERNYRITIHRLKESLFHFGIDHWVKNIRGEGYMLIDQNKYIS